MLFDRTIRSKAPASRTRIFPAPKNGWIRNESLAASKHGGAEVLDNWFPTPEGCRLRGGSEKHATLDAACSMLIPYDSGSTKKLFAADEDNFYDVTAPADPDVPPSAAVTNGQNGNWAYTQFTNSAGTTYIICVNGGNTPRTYQGTVWSTSSITGVTGAQLNQVWAFKNKLFFCRNNSISSYYLPTGAISGAATEFPLGGVFKQGGTLLFGTSLSFDSGIGLDDVCLFVTDQGEVAAYEGTDPSSSDYWNLVGVYKIGRPLGKNSWFRAGGDIAVCTDDGIVSIAQAMRADRTGIKAITFPIEEAWREIITRRAFQGYEFQPVVWPEKSMLFVCVPTFSGLSAYCLVANAKTGAWARYTGWDTRTAAYFDGDLYFGTSDGTVIKAETTGADQGTTYAGVCIPRFDTFGTAQEKQALHARFVGRTAKVFTPQLFANADYNVDIPTPFPADPDATGANVWGSGVWDSAVWSEVGEVVKESLSAWQAVSAFGHALAPGVSVASGRDAAPDLELIALHLQTMDGGVMC